MNRIALWMAIGIAIGAGVAQATGDSAWIAAGAGLGAAIALAIRSRGQRGKTPPEA